MTQYNFRTRLEPNLFSGHFDKAGTILVSRYAHSSCARMTRGAKTGYTTSLISVTSPNYWTIYRAYSTGFWHDFFRGFSFLSIFRVPGKTSVIRVGHLVSCLSVSCAWWASVNCFGRPTHLYQIYWSTPFLRLWRYCVRHNSTKFSKYIAVFDSPCFETVLYHMQNKKGIV